LIDFEIIWHKYSWQALDPSSYLKGQDHKLGPEVKKGEHFVVSVQ